MVKFKKKHKNTNIPNFNDGYSRQKERICVEMIKATHDNTVTELCQILFSLTH